MFSLIAVSVPWPTCIGMFDHSLDFLFLLMIGANTVFDQQQLA